MCRTDARLIPGRRLYFAISAGLEFVQLHRAYSISGAGSGAGLEDQKLSLLSLISSCAMPI